MHIPVMLLEVIDYLKINPSGFYVDVTFGLGGHTVGVLKHLNENGRILVLDRDIFSIRIAERLSLLDFRVEFSHASFDQLNNILLKKELNNKVDGIIADLGISNFQLLDISRGFSFNNNGFLDMRMNIKQELMASEWINCASFKDIVFVLSNFGEEKLSHKIANEIVTYRRRKFINMTSDLVEIVSKFYLCTHYTRKHPATRIFQAIRIFINNELQLLEWFLLSALQSLKLGGRLIVLSFNSLEDRIVKNFIVKYKFNLKCKKSCDGLFLKSVVKYLRPSISEIDNNISSRSAVMRVIERIY
ncbi:MAG: 16S rRNA (cytosine(1402)-N(4))-methyltransferase RsmH [Enterobacteriaceae bacterium]|nr:16S rRNA (cytosine(1402)-N(4))-methyltransferase RsmH [Enterobacteriaceae bacterium]